MKCTTNIWGMLVCLSLLQACTALDRPSHSNPSAIEQLLLSQALEQSLYHDETPSIPLPVGTGVTLDTAGLSAPHQNLRESLVAWLGDQGFSVKGDETQAQYRLALNVQAIGTENGLSFFGIPPVQSSVVPVSLPELSIYKAQHFVGYSRFSFDIFELSTGNFVRSTPWFQGSTYYNTYTVFFFINFRTTDLVWAP